MQGFSTHQSTAAGAGGEEDEEEEEKDDDEDDGDGDSSLYFLFLAPETSPSRTCDTLASGSEAAMAVCTSSTLRSRLLGSLTEVVSSSSSSWAGGSAGLEAPRQNKRVG